MKTKFNVENMQCASCVSTINKNLLKINGVYGVEANVAEQSIQIDHTEEVNMGKINDQLNELGYPQKKNKDHFSEKAEEWDSHPVRVAQAEIFFKKVAEIIPLNEKDKLMDFGCGTGLVGLHFLPYVKQLVMADNSPAMLSVLQKKIITQKLDPYKIELFPHDIKKLPSNELSVVVSLMTFHHLENVNTIVKQLYNKLKPGGHLAIGDLAKEDGSFHSNTVPHRGFDQQKLCEVLNKNGFQLVLCEIFNRIKKETPIGEKEFEQFIIIAKK